MNVHIISLVFLLCDMVKSVGGVLAVLMTWYYLAGSRAREDVTDGAEAAAESSSASECSCAGIRTET